MAGLSKSKLEQLRDMAQLANAAYSGAPVPAGWTNITSSLPALSSSYKANGYYANGAASAAVFRDAAGHIVLSIRGTDGSNDYRDDIDLALGGRSYYQKFIPLIAAVHAKYPSAALTFTGHSLGAAAVHELAGWNDARVAGASFFAFSSPIFSNSAKVSDAGFVNDSVYGSVDSVSQSDLRYLHYDSGKSGSAATADIHSAVSLAGVLDRLANTEAFMGAGSSYSMPTNAVIYAMGHSTFSGGTSSPNAGFSTPVYVIGRTSADTIHGFDTFAVKQIIDGLGGNDTIYGGSSSNNVLYGGSGNDQLYGRSSRDELFGGSGADKLSGGTGADTLHGGSGVDTLTGGDGTDRFVFDLKTDVSTGADHVTDFSGSDVIAIRAAGFGIAAGAEFTVVNGTAPIAPSGHLTMLYNTVTGQVSVDTDGSGAAAPIALATLDNHPASLNHGDFLII